MKAIVLVRHGAPEHAFELRDIPAPPLGPHDVRIAVEVSGLNFADVLARIGMYGEAPPLPSVLGYEVVGRIVERGAQVEGWAEGQRVLALTRFGGYASEVVTPARGCVAVPDGIAPAAATALGTQAVTAYYAAEELVRLHPGDVVLVESAAGGLGTVLVQLAKRRGCRVIGTVSAKEKLDHLKAYAVDVPLVSTEPGLEERIREAAPRGLDVAFTSSGGRWFSTYRRLLGPGGRLVAFGVASMAGPSKSALRAAKMALGFGLIHPLQLLLRSQSVLAINLLPLSEGRPEVLARCLREVMALAERGELKAHLGAVFPVEEVARAHALLSSRHSIGKVAVTWG